MDFPNQIINFNSKRHVYENRLSEISQIKEDIIKGIKHNTHHLKTNAVGFIPDVDIKILQGKLDKYNELVPVADKEIEDLKSKISNYNSKLINVMMEICDVENTIYDHFTSEYPEIYFNTFTCHYKSTLPSWNENVDFNVLNERLELYNHSLNKNKSFIYSYSEYLRPITIHFIYDQCRKTAIKIINIKLILSRLTNRKIEENNQNMLKFKMGWIDLM
jgi:hypothetical protein